MSCCPICLLKSKQEWYFYSETKRGWEPSEDPKITRDAFHLLMSFELNTAKRKGKKAFIPISWQIYTLDKLLIQVKHEFNASNKELYTEEALLAQGRI